MLTNLPIQGLFLAAWFAVFATMNSGAAEKKIYDVTDLEGISGVYQFTQTRETDTPLAQCAAVAGHFGAPPSFTCNVSSMICVANSSLILRIGLSSNVEPESKTTWTHLKRGTLRMVPLETESRTRA
jgi:hypothetical protein